MLFRASHLASQILLAAALLGTVRVSAADPKAEEPKTHTLFMGADLALERNREFLVVKDVSGGSFVVEVNGQPVAIPMSKGTISLRVNSSLKLTDTAAAVQDLKAERAYTPEHDPYKRFSRQQPGNAGNASAGLAGGSVIGAQIVQSAAQIAVNGTNGPGADVAKAGLDAARQNVATTTSNFDNALLASRSDYNDVGVYAGKLQAELDLKLFDAMELNFKVSAEKPLDHPYLVIIANYREPDAKTGEVKNWIYAQALDPINRHGAKIHILRGGFPPGFELQNYQLHLYNNGVELATNVAPKRVALTRDEAFQYVVIDYVGSHKEATLPAVPAMGRLPADFHARLAGGQLAKTYYVKVSKTGQAVAAFVDETCAQRVDDPYVTELVRGICFKPALEKGKPVEGISRLKLSELSL